MELINHSLDYTGKFNDKRLEKRAALLSSAFQLSRVSSIRSATNDEASQKAAYRFLNNDRVQEEQLIAALVEKTAQFSAGRDLLVIQDTTDIDLTTHSNRLTENSGIGPIGDHSWEMKGFNLHAALVMDARLHTILGFSSFHQWARNSKAGTKRDRKYCSLPIEQKEGYKWLRGCDQSKEVLAAAKSITFIEDREGDIYDQFVTIPDKRINLIIRSMQNRNVNEAEKLYDVLSAAPLAGTFTIEIAKDSRKNVQQRTATLQVRYTPITIHRPANKKKIIASVNLYAVEVKEVSTRASNPILWRLLTTHKVDTFEKAMWVIECYKCRWYIEQFFRLMKKQGFRIESSELQSGWAIRKLTVLLATSILKIMQMMLAYENEDAQPVNEVFDSKELQCMRVLQQQLQTDTIKNPYNKRSLSWATWIIARLGGWKGTSKERPPGPICLKNGIDKFNLIYQGWSMASPT
jgi:hypothetical protein